MDYIGAHGNINWLFVLAIISVFQWIFTIVFVLKYYSIIGEKITDDAFIGINIFNKKNRISFLHDYFYIYWNIYPIVFYAFFYYLDTSWESYLTQIIMIGGDKVLQEYNYFFLNEYTKWIDFSILIIIVIIAYMATFGTQIKKQLQYMTENKKIYPLDKQTNKNYKVYWWDIRIRKEIYWIRFIFLFFNMILVGFIAYLGFKVVLFVSNILMLDTLIINPLHPDTYGGLRVLMEISSVILAIYLLRAMMGIVGFLDHKDVDDKFQFLGDIYHFLYFFFGLGFIIFFIYRVDDILGNVDIKSYLSYSQYTSFNLSQDYNSSKIVEVGSNMSSYYTNILQFNKFPVDLSLYTSSIFTFVLPLALWFVVRIKDYSHE